ncbi:MAG TPA: Holliday junction resolvase RuvX [Kofleriaceae bacterium]|nr:Holliday junction resolvase RuvX [Kofleriaceae bacterium]
MRALALDIGSKTIGVAMTDEAMIAAHPLTVLQRSGHSGDAAAVAALVAQHGITDVVVGMPFELSGRIGHRARRVQDFAAVLRAALPGAVRMHEQDERFTTAQAERVLIAADMSRARRREVIDQQAAALILRAWLDAHSVRG